MGNLVENTQARQRQSSWANWDMEEDGGMRGWVLCQGNKWNNRENVQGYELYSPRHKTQALMTGTGWSPSHLAGSYSCHRQELRSTVRMKLFPSA